jgi:hypothetical protein
MNSLIVAARRPLFVLVLLTALASGVFVSIWLLPIGVLSYALAVALASRDPAVMRQRPASLGGKPSVLAEPLERIDRTLEAIDGLSDGAPAALADTFQRVCGQAAELAAQAHDLATRGETVERYLFAAPPLESDLQRVAAQLAATSDAETRRHLEETRTALMQQQRSVQQLSAALSRTAAQLASIGATLGNARADLVRLRAAPPDDVSRTGGRLSAQLDQSRADLGSFLAELETVLGSDAEAAVWDHKLAGPPA